MSKSRLFEDYMSPQGTTSQVPAKGLMNKWNRELTAIKTVYPEVDDMKLLTTAIMCENISNAIEGRNNMANLFEATQPADVSYLKRFAINLLTAVMPNLIAEDIFSVQPMLSRIGEIRYLKVLYGSSKAPVQAGQTMFSNFTGGDFSQHTYTSDLIEGEEFVGNGTQVEFGLEWPKVIPGSLGGLVGDQVLSDDGNGNVLLEGTAAGTINYTAGTITFTTAPDGAEVISVDYTYDNISAPVVAPEIQARFISTPIRARSRKLKSLIAFDALYDANNDFGISLINNLTSYSASQLKHEIDQELILDAYNKASSPGITWSRAVPLGVSLPDHFQAFVAELQDMANAMYANTAMAMPNFYVFSPTAATIIETLPQFTSDISGSIHGPYRAGYLAGIPVYKSPGLPASGFFTGYKGESLFDTGAIYAPYMPIVSTQYLMDASFTGSQGFATAYGWRIVNPEFYARGHISNTPTVHDINNVGNPQP